MSPAQSAATLEAPHQSVAGQSYGGPPPQAQARPDPRNLIWITSYPKSGNTWVRAFIHNLLREMSGRTDGAQDINRMSEHTVWEFTADNFERILKKPLSKMSHREIAKIRPEVQRQMSHSRPRPFFVKTHMAIGHDFQFPTININATLAGIHVVRNPLDLVISFSRYSDKTLDDSIAIMGIEDFKSSISETTVCEFMGSWSQNVMSWISVTKRPIHVMRYEDMLDNPIRPFSNLARFLRLPVNEAQIQAAIAKSSFAELKRQEEQNGFSEKPATAERFFREGRAGQWRDVLSRDQIQRIVMAHGPTMQRFGYMPPDCGMSIR